MKRNPQNSVLQRWKTRQQKASSDNHPTAQPRANQALPTRDQNRIWILQNLYPDTPFYNYVTILHFNGTIDSSVLRRSLQHIFEEQEVLRTSYPEHYGVPQIQLHKDLEFPFEELDLRSFGAMDRDKRKEAIYKEKANCIFDLGNPPLFSCTLLVLGEGEYELLLVFHHILIDEWSIRIFKEDLARYYSGHLEGDAPTGQTRPYPFTQYAVESQERNEYRHQLPFWKEYLDGEIPQLQLGETRALLSDNRFKGGHKRLEYSYELSTKALQLAKNLKITPFILFLGIHNILLSRYAMEEDIVVGTPISTRNDRELERVIGFFLNTLIVRSTVEPNQTFSAYLTDLNKTWHNILSHKDVPLEELVKELNPHREYNANPFFNSMFLYFEKPEEPSFGPALELTHSQEYALDYSKFDITFGFEENKGSITSLVEYSTAIFTDDSIDRIQKHLILILEQVVANPEISVGSIPLMTSGEIRSMLSKPPRQPLPFSAYKGIHEVILDTARRSPKSIAVQTEKEQLSYRELVHRAKIVAFHVQLEGNKGIVGLSMENSTGLIVGMLGILMSGNAYLPLDPGYPKERLQFMIADAGITTVVTHSALRDKTGALGVKALNIDGLRNSKPSFSPVSVSRDDLAYMIYTSGSTGKPKGVPVAHGNILASTGGRLEFYDENPEAFLLLSSISFDSSKAGIFWSLTTGGTLFLPPKRLEQDPVRLGRILKEAGITHTLLLPSLYQVLLDLCPADTFSRLKCVIVAGEACTTELVQNHFNRLENTRLYNEYGPTEATVWCVAHEMKPTDKGIPIGKPVSRASIYLLDRNRQLVPEGAIGEIYIGGPGLTPGFHTHQKKEYDAFIHLQLGPNHNERLYKTGDLAKRISDGKLYYLGRIDEQVKIRGFRVELGEIEQKLKALKTVDQAVVLWDKTHNILRAAYWAKEVLPAMEVKRALAKSLPGYMVPNQLVQVDGFPKLPNGKIDRNAFLQVLRSTRTTKKIVAEQPLDEVQQTLMEVWKKLLNVEDIGLDDNYFDLGGDSIKSIQLIAEVRREGFSIHPNQVFNYPTIRELSLFLENIDSQGKERETTSVRELLPIQRWFFEYHTRAPEFWNMGVEVTGLGNISPDALNQALLRLMEVHPGLRSRYIREGAEWAVKTVEASGNYVCIEDLSGVEQPKKQRQRIRGVMQREQAKFDLSEGPLFKAFYFKMAKGSPFIYFVAHHLLVDVVSWEIIREDLDAIVKKEIAEGTKDLKVVAPFSWVGELKEKFEGDFLLKNREFWRNQAENATVWPGNPEPLSLREGQMGQVERRIELFNSGTYWPQVHRAYGTKTDEILLTALLLTVHKTVHTEKVSLWLEKTGRPQQGFTSDFSRIVGWLTSFFPITLRLPDSNRNPGSCIRFVKEQLRRIPVQGLDYGVLRYSPAHEMEAEIRSFYPQLVFNYTGEKKPSLAKDSLEFMGFTDNLRHPDSERMHNLEMNSRTEGSAVVCHVAFNPAVLSEEEVEDFLDILQQELLGLTAHCAQVQNRQYTPSDFSLISLTQDAINRIQNSPEPAKGALISTILPLSEIQNAMLIHRRTQAKDSGFIAVRFRIKGELNEPVFEQALQTLVKRHEILRSSVYWQGLSHPALVVYDTGSIELHQHSVPSGTNLETYLSRYWQRLKNEFSLGISPLLKVYLLRITADEHLVLWPAHHILLDGWSSANLLRELVHIYDKLISQQPVQLPGIPGLQTIYRGLVIRDSIKQHAFWEDSFRNFHKDSAIFPSRYKKGNLNRSVWSLPENKTAAFKARAMEHQISPNTVIRAFWAILESVLTKSSDTCFGATVSGRAGGIPGMENAAGMFMNVLPVRIRIDRQKSVGDWLAEIQDRGLAALEYEHTPHSYFERFFENKTWNQIVESLVIFESHPWDPPESHHITIEEFKSGATSNYPLNLIVVPGTEYRFDLITATAQDSLLQDWLQRNLEILIQQFTSKGVSTVADLLDPLREVDFELPALELQDQFAGITGKQTSNATEAALQIIWNEILGIEMVGIQQDFFEVGGTSLDVIHLFARIDKELNLKLPPTTILFHPTIEKLSEHLLQNHGIADHNSSLVTLKSTGWKDPLFCIHGGEGHILFYRELSKYIDPDRPIYLLQPRGINGDVQLHDSLEEMAADYIDEIESVQGKSEINLVYFCYSALAIEMAHQLKKNGKQPNLIIIDSTAESLTEATRFSENNRIQEYLKKLKRYPLITIRSSLLYRYRRHIEPFALTLFKDRETLRLKLVRDNLKNLFDRYKWKVVDNKAVLILLSGEHPDLVREKITRWTHWLGEEPQVLYTTGNHFSIFEEPHVAMLGKHIEKACSQ